MFLPIVIKSPVQVRVPNNVGHNGMIH